ncbi:MAG TPA: PaaI family thioesterase [Thermoanaerobaculia bacterium]|nr:PaaI family thioesterase [Thermoanaerobaculia bacterium]
MSLEGKPFSPAYGTLESLGTLADVWNAGPPMAHFGARLEFDRIDRVRAVIDPVKSFHRGGMGSDAVNGVVLAGLFDLVIGTVGWLTRPETRSATVNLSMTFFKATRGERIVAEARLVRAGMNLVFAAAEIFDSAGEVTARCDGTCAVAHGKTNSQKIYERMRAGKIVP